MNQKTFRYLSIQASILVGSVAFIGFPLPSTAETLHVPWECSNYTGDAQTRCVNALIEAQQKKIAELEGKLQAQEGTVSQLKSQLDRQSTATADLQRQLIERPTTSVIPVPYSYAYPFGLGFGLHFGNSGLYASPYYGPYSRHFGGHRHHGYWGYRW
ncbi:MAG: hypothetical protein IPM58_15325 [Nitrospira sp.]|nr:hypothetical protein [Nitrospira sp.]